MYSLVLIFTLCFSLANFAASDELSEEIARQSTRCRADYFEPWTYRKDLWNGPEHWGELYEQCHGFRQSPIDIQTERISNEVSPHFGIFVYPYPIENPTYINDGHALVVLPGDENLRFLYLNYTRYDFVSAHFHFGCSKCCGERGSEHSIDGKSYDMELHLIHRSAENKTAVAAIFFQESSVDTSGELCQVTNAAKKVMYKGMNTTSEQRLDLRNLVPAVVVSYYQYEGSLTAPDCDEAVTWAVVEPPMVVGSHQMDELRKLYRSPQGMTEDGCKLCGNIRPQQPLHRRKVYKSWAVW